MTPNPSINRTAKKLHFLAVGYVKRCALMEREQ